MYFEFLQEASSLVIGFCQFCTNVPLGCVIVIFQQYNVWHFHEEVSRNLTHLISELARFSCGISHQACCLEPNYSWSQDKKNPKTKQKQSSKERPYELINYTAKHGRRFNLLILKSKLSLVPKLNSFDDTKSVLQTWDSKMA